LAQDEASTGCVVFPLVGALLPVYLQPSEDSLMLVSNLSERDLAEVTDQLQQDTETWIAVRFSSLDGTEIEGWVRIPDGVAAEMIYRGPRCP
jgi:hypothetical protein